MISLWIATDYLQKQARARYASLLTALPAAFMSAVTATYILLAEEGFRLSPLLSYHLGIGFGYILFCLYLVQLHKRKKDNPPRHA